MKTVKLDGNNITPSKIICIGRNYVEHIVELGNEIPEEMVVFNKPNSAISQELHSFKGEPIHFEAELCFIYQAGRLAGVGFGLDLTKRELQNTLKTKGLPWERAKAFDGSAVFSDFVSINTLDVNLSINLMINDINRQAGGIDLMIFTPEKILTELQSYTSLQDGDIIMTGTPKGVGVINKGDYFVGQVLSQKKPLTSGEWLAI